MYDFQITQYFHVFSVFVIPVGLDGLMQAVMHALCWIFSILVTSTLAVMTNASESSYLEVEFDGTCHVSPNTKITFP